MARLRVDFAGPHVSVQDAGRPGRMRFGVPGSGPLDRRAFTAANLALGNPAGAAGVEVSMGGLRLTCLEGELGYAVAGGGFILEHLGKRGAWSVATLRAGETLAIRPGPWGSWCCLAFAGRLQAPEWLGAQATHALSGLGGGRLAAGQVWQVDDARPVLPRAIPCPVAARPRHDIRVTLGPQTRFFAPETVETLLTAPWKVTEAWDRMGMRLAGPRIAPEAALDMASEPILRGSVQVAGDGVPSVLLADHQTTGGYPKIATVLDCELEALVQLRPRDPLRFHAVTPEAAVQIARAQAARDARYFKALEQETPRC